MDFLDTEPLEESKGPDLHKGRMERRFLSSMQHRSNAESPPPKRAVLIRNLGCKLVVNLNIGVHPDIDSGSSKLVRIDFAINVPSHVVLHMNQPNVHKALGAFAVAR